MLLLWEPNADQIIEVAWCGIDACITMHFKKENMEHNQVQNHSYPPPYGAGKELPNAMLSMIMGIISLVLTMFAGLCLLSVFFVAIFPAIISFILSIVGLVAGRRGHRLYKAYPQEYSRNSYNNLQLGKITSIISLVVSAFILFFGLIFAGIFAAILGIGLSGS